MVRLHTLRIDPPLLNSSCAWASDLEQLRELYECPSTGAVTTRTATLDGFEEGPGIGVVFTTDGLSTLNTYGYSPHPLGTYLEWIYALLTAPASPTRPHRKPFILSITSALPAELTTMLTQIQALRSRLRAALARDGAMNGYADAEDDPAALLAVELNTSCPNIPGKPPPSYALHTLAPLLAVLGAFARADLSLALGLKLPPYPDPSAATGIVACLHEFTYTSAGEGPLSPFAFLTCTNTLGSSLLFASQVQSEFEPTSPTAALAPALPPGLGGLGGALIHPLALGTVFALSRALAAHPSAAVRNVGIIGVGGVLDAPGARRMRAAGATAVACATALGARGVGVFAEIRPGVEG
ncbi:hypothetical protein BKA93DRAFT_903568 [Sparassis latifolia]